MSNKGSAYLNSKREQTGIEKAVSIPVKNRQKHVTEFLLEKLTLRATP